MLTAIGELNGRFFGFCLNREWLKLAGHEENAKNDELGSSEGIGTNYRGCAC